MRVAPLFTDAELRVYQQKNSSLIYETKNVHEVLFIL